MQRRTFLRRSAAILAALGSARASAAEPAKSLPLIGVLGSTSAADAAGALASFREGLRGQGFVEGKNVRVTYRWADGDYARLPGLAAELVRLGPAVIVAEGGIVSERAAQAATKTIPIVGPSAGSMVKSFSRPGGNLTGAATQTGGLDPKRLQLLHEAVPGAARVAVLVNPASAGLPRRIPAVTAEARALGLSLVKVEARNAADFAAAFAAMAEQHTQALFVLGDPFFFQQHRAIIALALRYTLPAIYEWGEIAEDGGLMAYGDSLTALYRRVGDYAGRILKGAKPGDLPLDEPAAIRLVINLKTAKAIGLALPPVLLARADRVIE